MRNITHNMDKQAGSRHAGLTLAVLLTGALMIETLTLGNAYAGTRNNRVEQCSETKKGKCLDAYEAAAYVKGQSAKVCEWNDKADAADACKAFDKTCTMVDNKKCRTD